MEASKIYSSAVVFASRVASGTNTGRKETDEAWL